MKIDNFANSGFENLRASPRPSLTESHNVFQVSPIGGVRDRTKSYDNFIPKISIRESIYNLSGNKAFWCLNFCLTGFYFIVTGIQYWLPTYFIVVFKLTPEQATIFYTTTSITAPIAGVIVGGIITTALGGYNTASSQKAQMILGICCFVCVLPTPFVDF